MQTNYVFSQHNKIYWAEHNDELITIVFHVLWIINMMWTWSHGLFPWEVFCILWPVCSYRLYLSHSKYCMYAKCPPISW